MTILTTKIASFLVRVLVYKPGCLNVLDWCLMCPLLKLGKSECCVSGNYCARVDNHHYSVQIVLEACHGQVHGDIMNVPAPAQQGPPWDEDEAMLLSRKGIAPKWPQIFTGQFTEVLEGVTPSGKGVMKIALKMIDKGRAAQLGMQEAVEMQRQFYKEVKGRYFVKILTTLDIPIRLWVAMEWYDSNLSWETERLEQKHPAVPEAICKRWFTTVMDALRYMHHMGWTHRRLTPNTILYSTSRSCMVLAGFSQVVKCKREKGLEIQDHPNATLFFPLCSPKRLSRLPYDPYDEDVYSLGMLIYVTMNRHTALKTIEDLDMLRAFVSHQLMAEIENSGLSRETKNLILKLCNMNQDRRPRMKDVVKDPWVTANKSLFNPYAQWPNPNVGAFFAKEFKPPETGKGWDEKNKTLPNKIAAAGYRIDYKIGRGAYGLVYKAWKKNRPVACKVVDISKANHIDPWYAKRYTKELDIIRSYDHPNLCKVLDVFIERNRRGIEETQLMGENRRIFIFMEYCISDLLGVCRANPDHRLHEVYARRYLQGVAEGLKYLHGKRVAHRDMKMDNILVRNQREACVTDFSYAKETPQTVLADSYVGTMEYRSPQILKEQSYDPYAADVWAYGCCIAMTITGNYLFYVPMGNRNNAAMLKEVVRSNEKIAATRLSDQARDLIRKCVAPHERDRIPFGAILQHEWFKVAAEKLTYRTWPANSNVRHPDPTQPPHPLHLR